ncbi:uncharacterized protein N7469_001610 [Penicillium citrinum]|uniref:Shikimate dehydrogenase substrate binding N-terminal domain-containing protein n=2 Tax=Penicillium TaxID=5073 RepID=A0A9W9PHV3_PENCI|nr:uncharacterized protein N7469_001610 [Penicillium citrinum]KAJ5243283.1 hypothetical protein N7469_001610 [Penicillium citrinum]
MIICSTHTPPPQLTSQYLFIDAVMDILQQSYRYGKSPLIFTPTPVPRDVFLFGGNISRSLSPLLHGILFKSRNTRWAFTKVETTYESEFKTRLNSTATTGASITMPNKVTFGKALDDLTEDARMIGAVNTSFVRVAPDGRRVHIGTNTDCVGIRDAILHRHSSDISAAYGKAAMVIGGGGAARSAIYALWKWFRPSEIYIANRLKSEVEDIMSHFKTTIPSVRLRHIETTITANRTKAPYIIVGTIPDYAPAQQGEILCARICEIILRKPEKGLLVDMCYMPSPQTNLINIAQDYGWETIVGTDVLVRVCVAQQILWVEEEPNEMDVQQALAALREVSRTEPARL